MLAVRLSAERRVERMVVVSLAQYQTRYRGQAGWHFVDRHQFRNDAAVAAFLQTPRRYYLTHDGRISAFAPV